MAEPRIATAESPFSPVVATALERIMPPGVPPLLLFRTLARNERVFSRVMAGGLLDRGTLTLRERELVIDRTCFRCGAEYEWGVHVAFFGPKARLTDDEVKGLCEDDPEKTPFSPTDRLLLRLADELHSTSRVTAALWEELSKTWSAEQLIELVALAGYYHLISFATNAFELPLEPFAARFPR